MTDTPLDRLLTSEAMLIEALDGQDVAALEAATAAMTEGVKAVKDMLATSREPDLLERVRHALALADAARARVNYLTDRNRRRLDLLAQAVGAERRAPAYGRDGRIRN